jgi:preprotein translocase subunit SecA
VHLASPVIFCTPGPAKGGSVLKGLIGKVVGDPNEKEVRKLQPLVEAINAREAELERRTDAELRNMTGRFRARLAAGDSPDDLLVEVFAVVREAAKRSVDMRPFDVQLIGGIVLHQGKVAEMKTGEGKTLVATMPLVLNALLGRGVHLVTVNDYLARRDSLWMGAIYHLLGLSVGLLQSGMEQPAYLYDPAYDREPYPGLRPVPRREAYRADITYGTNNEFGFDYLRDNLAYSLDRRVQRPLFYAIVDEVDNIFIDEARTPLIISGESDEPVEEYSRFADIARKLETGVHYELDEKEHSVFLTDEGLAVVEQETGIENIYDEANYRYVHYMQQALKAQVLFQEGRDYIRQRKQIILIDQHTGRLMPSRRLSEGLHQAIEAKEGVPVRPRDVTSATITIQNYFRMYEKLAGMSGTALTESEEFYKIYKLDVASIPTHKPVARADHADVVYRTEEAKFRAVAREILACHSRGQPVLVGTTSVEMSERLGRRLTGERLQMAALAPRAAYALQDAEIDRELRATLREIMNDSLETMNSASWRRMFRDLDLNANGLVDENLEWIASYLELPDEPAARRDLERALREGIAHQILNAKEHTREAAIIARAGEPGTVTIATNMAGRGVDIKLGGELSDEVIHRAHLALQARGLDPFSATPAQMDSAIAEVAPQYARYREQVLAVGGLHILGTERHEARRIDNQLRGRAGRQGEPGSSRFYLSLEDELMRRFGRREMLSKLMEQMGDDFPIEHGLVSKFLERAQTSVEGYNFDIRKHLLEYDDVLNRQRETIYGERLRILQSPDLRAEVWRMLEAQVHEYMEKGEDGDQESRLFVGLDDVVPLIVPAPSAAFQGPVAFGGRFTAFPPFTISFLADQLAERPVEQAQEELAALARQAAASYGEQIRGNAGQVVQSIQSGYQERLERYQTLLDEKIGDYEQLLEERNQAMDARRLAQHLERTYPLKLTLPPLRDLQEMEDLDDLRDHWLVEIEDEFHRETCAALMERVRGRLPLEAVGGLDRLRPARLPAARLGEELQRVRELAARQPRDEGDRRRLEGLRSPDPADTAAVLAFVNSVKELSNLDYGRLDRLISHVLGAYLDDLLGQYAEAAGPEQGRVQRELERLQGSVVEAKKGGARPLSLLDVLRQVNDLVHLDIPVLEDILGHAVAHEYDKWAQRQLAEIEADASRSPLAGTSWTHLVEHLLATHYTEYQVYDRAHRRQASWMPRLPFHLMAQAYADGMDPRELQEEVMRSLRWAVDQREQAWGRQEMKRWQNLSLDDLDEATYEGLLHYLGRRELEAADLGPETIVDDLPEELYEHLRFILALRQLEERNPRLGEIPHADDLLQTLGHDFAEQLLEAPFGTLDPDLQESAREHLRQAGHLDDPALRTRLLDQPMSAWEQRTREAAARFWGRRYIQEHADETVEGLAPWAREATIAYLEEQRRFVDEGRVQRFLVHQGLGDLDPQVRQDALLRLARTRLDRASRRKISNLDVGTRQAVTDALQRMGLFTDEARREGLQAGSLADLDAKTRRGFEAFLGRQVLAGRSLASLDDGLRQAVTQVLKQDDALSDPAQVQGLAGRHLVELDGDLVAEMQAALRQRLRSELATRTMEELPAATRAQIHQALNEQDYFVDEEKVGWYERKTLAQLAPDLLRGLEQHMGRTRLAGLEKTPFAELSPEIKDTVLAFLDGEGLLADRAERLRLTQGGSLAILSPQVRNRVAGHLGRQWLVAIRDRRPPALPEEERSLVWGFLRDQGTFADEFKEELFAYQRLDEFDAQTQEAVESALVRQLATDLKERPIGELPAEIQAAVQAHLVEADYFVDAELLAQVQELPPGDLPGELGQQVERALGACLLSRPSSLNPEGRQLDREPIQELPAEIQAWLWRYLDEMGYFLDEKKRAQVLDRRLEDLGSDQYETLIAEVAGQLRQEIGDRPVSDLPDELRQGLRESLESAGYFYSDEVRAQVLGQRLGQFRREEVEGLSADLGLAWLDQSQGKGLRDLPEADRAEILAHLQARDWFLDEARLARLQAQPLRDLDPEVRDALVDDMRRQEVERLRQQRLAGLSREQRRVIHTFLLEHGLAAEEARMRPLRRTALQDLPEQVYGDLLQNLGLNVVSEWATEPFQALGGEQRDLLAAYLGRRILARIERQVLLYTISRLWIDYLTDIEDLRRGIGLEAYGQRDPLVEYKRRAFELFEELGHNIRRTVVRSLFRQPPEPLRAA